ncbi:MAG: carboxypeptidase regulatory-like domain-containing protein [Candidatus Acidiferrales bacterium]
MFFFASQLTWSQTTISQGSIQGTVTDPTGLVVPGTAVTITNQATGQVINVTTTSAGAYNSGGLLPGTYVVRVEATGFKTVTFAVTVQVATTASGNVKLELGQSSQVVEVQSSTVTVNTEQATVQGVITADQISKLPINGRNFLDIAQLEPGVQMQDGAVFDPTKAGYSSISINGVYGRTPRIEVDGLDITDETVGTTTQNIALSSIQEFNISRSFLDLSTELTSAGAVNLSTKSGTNGFHGTGFYNFRDDRVGFAAFPGGQNLPFQRNQYGGGFGGPVLKDKLFFFIDAERTKQDGLAPVILPYFVGLNSGYSSPFRDNDVMGKLDWQASKNIHAFYKFSYNSNSSASTYYSGYPVYDNKDNVPAQAGGVDINSGNWSHSFRAGYFKFHNEIVDGSQNLPPALNPVPEIGIEIRGGLGFFGPNLLAPQGTFQSNKQFKYDGSWIKGSHVIRFGAGVNRIEGGGFAAFFGTAPLDESSQSHCPDPTSVAACTLTLAILGNGQGFFTEKPGFGLPAGGQSDTRFSAYVGDSWKVKPNFTLTYGLRYNRDTGRTDSDLAPIPCSEVSSAITPAPCSGSSSLFDQWQPGFGARIRQPNENFGPQVGFAWDPKSDGKTVIRAGVGIYYENSIFNNTLFDRPGKLAQGLFSAQALLICGAGGPGSVSVQYTPSSTPVTSIDGLDLATQVCGQPLSVAGQPTADLQKAYQAAIAAAGPSANPNFVGNTLSLSTAVSGLAAYSPNYQTPRSYQFNIGGQRQLWKGGVLTADYIRDVSVHFPLTIDVNHVGDARFLNVTAAQNAIGATTGQFGCGGGFDSASIDCAIGAGATINDFAGNGLDSGLSYLSGSPAGVFGLTPDTGAAFAGQNPLMGVGDFEEPIGRSVYNALQTSYKQQISHPIEGLASMNLQIAYTLSRFVGNGGNDQNFSAAAWDNNNPTRYMGPTSLDRLHQFKFGLVADVAHRGPEISIVGAFSSAPPTTLTMLTSGGATTSGEIFRTDFTGDGTVGDTFPAFSGPGQFGRSISANSLAAVVSNYNSTQAGTLTPAGQSLVGAGLFTSAQLQALGGVKPFVNPPPPGQYGNGMFREVSMIIAWPIKITETFSIVPSVSAYNVFNFSNFGILDGNLANQIGFAPGTPGSVGSVSGTGDPASRDSLRIGTGSGVFSQASPREMEFTLKLNF